jgi:hypothetical protein
MTQSSPSPTSARALRQMRVTGGTGLNTCLQHSQTFPLRILCSQRSCLSFEKTLPAPRAHGGAPSNFQPTPSRTGGHAFSSDARPGACRQVYISFLVLQIGARAHAPLADFPPLRKWLHVRGSSWMLLSRAGQEGTPVQSQFLPLSRSRDPLCAVNWENGVRYWSKVA